MAFSLVIGGVASGKSLYAELALAGCANMLRPLIYLATAKPDDTEMREKVEKHKARRGEIWQTIEAPFAPQEVIGSLKKGQALLLDCVTLWAFNLWMAGEAKDEIVEKAGELASVIKSCAPRAEIVVVTNELGGGVIPDNYASRAFQNLHGRVNQELASQADNVINVVSGIPFALKGRVV